MKLTESVEERIRGVFANCPGVSAVYLFGSHAEGRARPDSDIDLAVVPEQGRELRSRKLDFLTALARQGLINVDLVILDRDDAVLNHEAIRMNRLLYAKPEFDRGWFYSKVIRDYLDFLPFMKVQREAMKARLAHGAV